MSESEHQSLSEEEEEIKRKRSTLTPEQARAAFETTHLTSLVEERELNTEPDSPGRALAVYELQIDTSAQEVSRKQISSFLLSAAEAGYNQLSSPLIIPTTERAESDKTHASTAIYFLFEKLPLQTSEPAQTGQEKQSNTDSYAGIPRPKYYFRGQLVPEVEIPNAVSRQGSGSFEGLPLPRVTKLKFPPGHPSAAKKAS